MKSIQINWKHIRTSLFAALLLGGILASCGKKDDPTTPVTLDKVALQAAIATAQNLVSTTSEGTHPGQYTAGSQAALAAALAAANAVLTNANSTQVQINNATQQLLAAIAAYSTHYIDEIAAASLVGFWKMNGNANDSSGNNHNGVLTAGHPYYGAGTPTLTADRFGRANMAYHFDNGGNIQVPYNIALNPSEMSFSVWAKWSSAGRTVNANTYTMVALNRWNGFKFQLQDTHIPFMTVKVVKTNGDTTYIDRAAGNGFEQPENTWRHLVVTYKSGVESFYVDGDLVKTWDATSGADAPPPGLPVTLANPIDFVIGQDLPTSVYTTVDGDYQVAWGGFWTGDMDDVMFYNVALTGPQVQSIWTNQHVL